jgi:hypothetical protein
MHYDDRADGNQDKAEKYLHGYAITRVGVHRIWRCRKVVGMGSGAPGKTSPSFYVARCLLMNATA